MSRDSLHCKKDRENYFMGILNGKDLAISNVHEALMSERGPLVGPLFFRIN